MELPKNLGSRSGWEATPEMVIVRRRNLVLSVQDPEYGGTRENPVGIREDHLARLNTP